MSNVCFSPTVCGNILKKPLSTNLEALIARVKTENDTVRGDFDYFFVV